MKILDKKELNSILGKESMWAPKRLVSKVNYVSGIDSFDELLDGKLFTEVIALINLKGRPGGIQIEMMKGIKYYSVGIKSEDITQISIEDKEQIIEKKDKSVIGRALIGGIILGPVGAIIGGMTGMGEKDVKGEMPDMIISIEHKSGIVLLSCKYKDRNKVESYLSQNCPSFKK